MLLFSTLYDNLAYYNGVQLTDKPLKIACNFAMATFVNGIATITLHYTYMNANPVCNILNNIIANESVSGNALTVYGITLSGVNLNGDYYVRYIVVGY